jgi:hypothetical protein
MTETINLSAKEKSALDTIDAEVGALGGGLDAGELCKRYQAIRSALLILIAILKKIPKFGTQAAAALEFLMSLADALCPA